MAAGTAQTSNRSGYAASAGEEVPQDQQRGHKREHLGELSVRLFSIIRMTGGVSVQVSEAAGDKAVLNKRGK